MASATALATQGGVFFAGLSDTRGVPLRSRASLRTQWLGRKESLLLRGSPSIAQSLPGRWRKPADPARAALKDWRQFDGEGSVDPAARRRLEQVWSIRQQPVPVACEECQAQGTVECEWCHGSGYFGLGDQLLCEVPSRNTRCLICHGEGAVRCPDCLGTGFRARWLEPAVHKKK